ncbi:MAG: hypothetical protein NDI81_00770 [Desulfobacula sp.]|nr:hypothetical protein [Desulfobacula sp.]
MMDLVLNKFHIFVLYCLIVGISIFFLFSCDRGKNDLDPNISQKNIDVTKTQWESLLKKNIYIGHRSVGNNLIQGIQDYGQTLPYKSINIIDIDRETDYNRTGIFHSWINESASPQTLATDYIHLVENKLKNKIDIAYIRFTPYYNTEKNLNKVLGDYNEAQLLLETKYPDTIFIQGTFPLGHTKITLKTRLKRILNYDEIWEYGHNLYTNQYNAKIREQIGQKPFFDFADIQSTFPDGRKSIFYHHNEAYYHMVSDYTYDDTHLNEKGRMVAAQNFLSLLLTLINK